jgi:hypothetical protein
VIVLLINDSLISSFSREYWILFAFTVQLLMLAAFFGFALFVAIILAEIGAYSKSDP